VVEYLRSENGRVHTFVNAGNAAQLLYGETRPEVYRWAKAAGAEDCWLPYGILSTYSAGFKITRNESIEGTLDTAPYGPKVALSRLANVHWWIVAQPGGRGAVSLDRIGIDSLSNNLPRAFLITDWRVVEGSIADEAIGLLASGAFERTAGIEVNPDGTTLPAPPVPDALASQRNPVGVTSFIPGRNRVHIEAVAPSRSLLVLDDTWYPGWKAFVDGRPEPIYRANVWFRGVFLEKGAHSVDFVYRPTHLGLALGASAAGAVILVLLWTLGGGRPARGRRGPGSAGEGSGMRTPHSPAVAG
jgi:hypothetical protein